MDLLDTPLLNKGTAFTEEERTLFGLLGLLPPHVETLEEQVVRAYEAYQRKDDDLERHIYLRALQDTNKVNLLQASSRPHRGNSANRLHANSSAGVSAIQSHLSPTARPLCLLSTPRLHHYAFAESPESERRCHCRNRR